MNDFMWRNPDPPAWTQFRDDCPHYCKTMGGHCGLLCGGYCLSGECRVPRAGQYLCREENCPGVEED